MGSGQPPASRCRGRKACLSNWQSEIGLAAEVEMRNLYLRNSKVFDEASSTWCLTGRDSRRRDIGVAAANSVEKAEQP